MANRAISSTIVRSLWQQRIRSTAASPTPWRHLRRPGAPSPPWPATAALTSRRPSPPRPAVASLVARSAEAWALSSRSGTRPRESPAKGNAGDSGGFCFTSADDGGCPKPPMTALPLVSYAFFLPGNIFTVER